MERTYLCIDLKSYYASVECVARGLDPMVINLVVADISRTDKTICLAVSPALKSFGVPGRARLFEVNQMVRDINYERRAKIPGKQFKGKVCYFDDSANELGGEYISYIGIIKKIESYPTRLVMMDGKEIFAEDILNIEEDIAQESGDKSLKK